MRFYIVDDDMSVVMILRNIIEKKGLGIVVGYEMDSVSAYEEIMEDVPDIILIDYLMPKLDGTALMKKVTQHHGDVRFIMISQVTDSILVEDAYKSGLEFFIHKPINIIEVESVIKSVIEKIQLIKKFEVLKHLVSDTQLKKNVIHHTSFSDQVRGILSEIAVLGEKGTTDLIAICEKKMSGSRADEKMTVSEYCLLTESNPKIVKQRIRRACSVGLRNIALIGIEDNQNECFLKYANKLYDYQDIWFEMAFVNGRRSTGGRVNIDKFIENLVLLAKNN